MFRNKLNIDVETKSGADLKKAGLYKYCADAEFEILILSYSLNDAYVERFDLANGAVLPQWFIDLIIDDTCEKIAWNAMFERNAIGRHLGIVLSPVSWTCTMVKAGMMGLPMNLGEAGIALGTKSQKLLIGKSLIRKFCIPQKISKKNTKRWLTAADLPEPWAQFCDYCDEDVYTEMDVAKAMSYFTVIDREKRLYILDQQINDRGILLDPQLIQHAIEHAKTFTQALVEEAIQITGLQNPKSVKQLKEWLELEIDESIPTLSKDAVIDLIKKCEDTRIRRVLEIRQQISKTSVKKYNAMMNMIMDDNRVRGIIRFYGANKTGRFASSGVQIHNLYKNDTEKFPDLALLRLLERDGQYDNIDMAYDTAEALSQLIRTTIVPASGCILCMSDFSAIEARVLAWFAGEEWKLEVFRGHGKIYEATGANMFNVPIEKVTKGSHYRQKAKIAELACIAEGQLVLTDKGLIPIEKVTVNEKLWDGVNWINHGGVIFKGIKTVFTYDGLTATPNHLVWVERKEGPIYFSESAACGAYLTRSGNDKHAIQIDSDNKQRKIMARGLERPLRSDKMYGMQFYSMDTLLQSKIRKIERMSAMQSTATSPPMARSSINNSKTTMRKSKRQRLQKLRSAGNKISVQFYNRSRIILNKRIRITGSGFRNRSQRKQQALRAWKYSFCYASKKQSKQTNNSFTGIHSERVALRIFNSSSKITCRSITRTNNIRCQTRSTNEIQKLATNKRKARVYDIINCGPRNRFTVSNVLVHNCGYQGSIGALERMGAVKMGMKKEDLVDIVGKWRDANSKIVKFWYDVEKYAIAAVRNNKEVRLRNLRFFVEHATLFIELPSGRRLAYLKPKIVADKHGYAKLVYRGVNPKTFQWQEIPLYGGLLVENIVQATSRDILAEKMIALDDAGYDIMLHVHDEIVCEIIDDYPEEGELGFSEYKKTMMHEIMREPLSWTEGLPLNADTTVSDFYKKD